MKKSIGGIAIACTIFTVIGMIMDIRSGGTLIEPAYAYTKMAAGAAAVGLGFSLPAEVYKSERIPMFIKVLVHMGIGCTVMIITAFVVGWIPAGAGITTCLAIIAAEIAAAFVIWIFYWRYYKKLAMKMNEHIAEKQDSFK